MKNRKVNENPMKEIKEVLTDLPFFHFGQNMCIMSKNESNAKA